MSTWACWQFSVLMPSTSWQASTASSQDRHSSSLAPSSSSTCLSLVVSGGFLSFINIPCSQCFNYVSTHPTKCFFFLNQGTFPGLIYRNVDVIVHTLFDFCRRLQRRPHFLPLLHAPVLLHNFSTFLPQLVSWRCWPCLKSVLSTTY